MTKPSRKFAEGSIRIGDEPLTGVAITCIPQGGSVNGETLLAIANSEGKFFLPCVPGNYFVMVTEPKIVPGLDGGEDKPFWDPANPEEGTISRDDELTESQQLILNQRNDLVIPEIYQDRDSTPLEITLTDEPPAEPIDLNLE